MGLHTVKTSCDFFLETNYLSREQADSIWPNGGEHVGASAFAGSFCIHSEVRKENAKFPLPVTNSQPEFSSV